MYRIAVIEDNPVVRKLLNRTLAAEGFECFQAQTVAEGLKVCAQEKPDIVLMDVHLPDGNGIEACRQLKADEKLRHIPILILTGEAVSIEDRVGGFDAGADDYVIKPFDVNELIMRIRGILKAGVGPTRK